MEFELYRIKELCPDLDASLLIDTNFCISLSRNSHPMATNLLYSHFDSLNETFTQYFHLSEATIFLHEKLKLKYSIPTYHITCSFSNEDAKSLLTITGWKYWAVIKHICESRPLKDVLLIPIDDLRWYYLCTNTHKCVIEFLKLHSNEIYWDTLSRNSCDYAVDYLLECGRVDWAAASLNTNEKIIRRFKEHKNELCIAGLCQNTSSVAIQFLLNEPDLYSKINWKCFCKNPNDLAIDNIPFDKIEWEYLCANENPRVFSILEKNREKINWNMFFSNPMCFQYNYEKMRERCSLIKEELTSIFMHPHNIMARIDKERLEGETDFDVCSRIF